jgi:hypothetical protein
MKLRLHGTPAECTAAAQRLRSSELVRVNLTVHRAPAPARGRGAADDRA